MSKKATGELMCKMLKGKSVSMCRMPYCADNNYCVFSGDGSRAKPNFLIKLGWQDVAFRKDEKGIPVTIWTAKI